jgi:hypothetical protein
LAICPYASEVLHVMLFLEAAAAGA